jgi:hypothetical protein
MLAQVDVKLGATNHSHRLYSSRFSYSKAAYQNRIVVRQIVLLMHLCITVGIEDPLGQLHPGFMLRDVSMDGVTWCKAGLYQ